MLRTSRSARLPRRNGPPSRTCSARSGREFRMLVHVDAHAPPAMESHAARRPGRPPFAPSCASGPAPGLLAFDGDKAVAWCAIAPRRTPRNMTVRKSPTCPTSSGTNPLRSRSPASASARAIAIAGCMGLLAEAAVAHAKSRGASSVDVCAIETDRKLMWGEGFVGIASVFRSSASRRSPPHAHAAVDAAVVLTRLQYSCHSPGVASSSAWPSGSLK